ncbi:MAG: aconitate hydratase 1 [Gammaproteobacteria bacterium RBG_16_66_13]|nr:MAG: aconitate hydratase 1 [Gammaproteobacteria bacterium RBG_16_66_13]
MQNVFQARRTLRTRSGDITFVSLPALEAAGLTRLERLPHSIRILLESVVRQVNGRDITEDDVRALAAWSPRPAQRPEVPFLPARVIMQDFTGVPAVVDLAAMRQAVARLGGDPHSINPRVPVDLVIDHSVQVDFFASQEALRRNADLEFQRNQERYEFLRWGQEAFDNFRVVPPATGIVHQVNLEYLAQVVLTRREDGGILAFPDTLVGTDSHTTMINGLGVLGWGVGGIEAEAVMLGQPIDLVMPQVVGLRLTGRLPEGTTATDLTLTVTERLRKHGVVDKFVEVYGPGLAGMPLPDRATIANMAPECGATATFFPVDDVTLGYLRLTGRNEDLVDLVERYTKEQGLFRTNDTPDPEFSESLELDLATVEASLAGPKRPQDRVSLSAVGVGFETALQAPVREGGYGLPAETIAKRATVGTNGASAEIGHGAVVIAAITSCTNTSNPSVMVGAGLLARNALARGLRAKAYVKTSLAPGSRVVTEYLRQAGLLGPLAELGFNLVGYGCTTCIGNSGPLSGEVVKAITTANLVAAAVLSGNRNFEGRVNPHVRASYLASPPLVVAFALAGSVTIDLTREPLGTDATGRPVYLRDIWPSEHEIDDLIRRTLTPEVFRQRYADVFTGNETWNQIPVAGGDLYRWDPDSTYIQEPPFFSDLSLDPPALGDILGARVLAVLGHSITTDHISPAGAIPADSPAGRYLIERGVQPRDFNSFGSRRGNDQVMTRGTFGNTRLKNLLVPGVEGGLTLHFPDGERMAIFDAAMRYREDGVPLIVLAGREYGAGSSRDWAAKGPRLLGVRAVIAESFERIHRSNLVGMGVLPLEFLPGQTAESLGLTGHELYHLRGLRNLVPRSTLRVEVQGHGENVGAIDVQVRIDTPIELEYFRNGGILQTVLRQMVRRD